MLAVKIEKSTYSNPKKIMKCPVCQTELTFWSVAPYVCKECKNIVPSADIIIDTLHGRIEYYRCVKEKW